MQQEQRIKTMERHLDRASQAVMRLSAALDEYTEATASLRELEAYYTSDEWKHDFNDDTAGRLPAQLKRGVLTEDAIWNVLEDNRELRERMKTIVTTAHEAQ